MEIQEPERALVLVNTELQKNLDAIQKTAQKGFTKLCF